MPQGWSNWDGTSRDLTAYYAEFENTGPGSSIKERLSVNHELTPDEAEMYSKENTLAPQCLNISSITLLLNNLYKKDHKQYCFSIYDAS